MCWLTGRVLLVGSSPHSVTGAPSLTWLDLVPGWRVTDTGWLLGAQLWLSTGLPMWLGLYRMSIPRGLGRSFNDSFCCCCCYSRLKLYWFMLQVFFWSSLRSSKMSFLPSSIGQASHHGQSRLKHGELESNYQEGRKKISEAIVSLPHWRRN